MTNEQTTRLARVGRDETDKRAARKCGGCDRRYVPGRICPHILGADDEPTES